MSSKLVQKFKENQDDFIDKDEALKQGEKSVVYDAIKNEAALTKIVKDEIYSKWKLASDDVRNLLDQTANSKYLRPLQKEKISQANTIFDLLTGLIGDLINKETKMQTDLDILTAEKEKAVASLHQATAQIREKAKEITQFKDKNIELSQEINQVKQENQEQMQKIGMLENRCAAMDDELSKLRGELETKILEERQKWLDKVRGLENYIEMVEEKLQQTKEALEFEKENAQMVIAKMQQGTQNLQKLEEQVADLNEELEKHKENIAALEEDTRIKQATIETLRHELIDMASEIPPELASDEEDLLNDPVKDVPSREDNLIRQKKFKKKLPKGAKKKIKGGKKLPAKTQHLGNESGKNVPHPNDPAPELDDEEDEDFEDEEENEHEAEIAELYEQIQYYEQNLMTEAKKQTRKERDRLHAEAKKTRGQLQKSGEQMGDQIISSLNAFHNLSKGLVQVINENYKGPMFNIIDEIGLLDLKARAEHNKILNEFTNLMNYQNNLKHAYDDHETKIDPNTGQKIQGNAANLQVKDINATPQVQAFTRSVRRTAKELNDLTNGLAGIIARTIVIGKEHEKKEVHKAIEQEHLNRAKISEELSKMKEEEVKLKKILQSIEERLPNAEAKGWVLGLFWLANCWDSQLGSPKY